MAGTVPQAGRRSAPFTSFVFGPESDFKKYTLLNVLSGEHGQLIMVLT